MSAFLTCLTGQEESLQRESGFPQRRGGLRWPGNSAVRESASEFEARECARPSARGPERTNERALSSVPAPDWAIQSSLSPGRGRAAPGTAWDRRARCARVPGARARSRVSRGGRSRAVSRRSCWRRRRRRRLAVGRGRGLRDSKVAGGSGVSGFFIPRLVGGPPEGCRPGRAEERLGRADRPPPGRGGKGRTRGRGAAAILINRSPGARRGRGGGARTPLLDPPHRNGDPG